MRQYKWMIWIEHLFCRRFGIEDRDVDVGANTAMWIAHARSRIAAHETCRWGETRWADQSDVLLLSSLNRDTILWDAKSVSPLSTSFSYENICMSPLLPLCVLLRWRNLRQVGWLRVQTTLVKETFAPIPARRIFTTCKEIFIDQIVNIRLLAFFHLPSAMKRRQCYQCVV